MGEIQDEFDEKLVAPYQASENGSGRVDQHPQFRLAGKGSMLPADAGFETLALDTCSFRTRPHPRGRAERWTS